MVRGTSATFSHGGISYFFHLSSYQPLFLQLVASFEISQKYFSDGPPRWDWCAIHFDEGITGSGFDRMRSHNAFVFINTWNLWENYFLMPHALTNYVSAGIDTPYQESDQQLWLWVISIQNMYPSDSFHQSFDFSKTFPLISSPTTSFCASHTVCVTVVAQRAQGLVGILSDQDRSIVVYG